MVQYRVMRELYLAGPLSPRPRSLRVLLCTLSMDRSTPRSGPRTVARSSLQLSFRPHLVKAYEGKHFPGTDAVPQLIGDQAT